jgi:hypothetical protein
MEKDEHGLANPQSFIVNLLELKRITDDLISAFGDYGVSQGWILRKELMEHLSREEMLEVLTQMDVPASKAKRIVGKSPCCPKCGAPFLCLECGFTYEK